MLSHGRRLSAQDGLGPRVSPGEVGPSSVARVARPIGALGVELVHRRLARRPRRPRCSSRGAARRRCSDAASGTAISAPGMPATITPSAIAMITPSGCTRDEAAHQERLQDVRLDLLHADHDAEHDQRGDTVPGATSATSTATVPETNGADHRDERAEEDQHADRAHERHAEDRGADHDADRVGARHDHRGPDELGQRAQATRPEESARSRAARGKSRTSQAQIRSPSARKKYVANSTMNRPATTWPTAVPTSVTWPTASLCCARRSASGPCRAAR